MLAILQIAVTEKYTYRRSEHFSTNSRKMRQKYFQGPQNDSRILASSNGGGHVRRHRQMDPRDGDLGRAPPLSCAARRRRAPDSELRLGRRRNERALWLGGFLRTLRRRMPGQRP